MVSFYVILSESEGSSHLRWKKILRHFVPQNDKKREAFASMLKQGYFPCHPERMRRIFAPSMEKRFFVTLFLRMTYTGGCSGRNAGFLSGIRIKLKKELPRNCKKFRGSFLMVIQAFSRFSPADAPEAHGRSAEAAPGILPPKDLPLPKGGG